MPDRRRARRPRRGRRPGLRRTLNRPRRAARSSQAASSRRDQIERGRAESFTKLLRLPEFSNQREASFAAWLARIAFNVCYDELRRNKRRPESALSEVSEEEAAWLREQLADESAGSDVEAAATAKDLAGKLLARLSPEDRLLLVMLDVEGMSVSEIAENTKWSASNGQSPRAPRTRVACARCSQDSCNRGRRRARLY